jgi:hypothetical protein
VKSGVRVGKSTVQKQINKERESRASKQTWATFLRNHASQIWACDFLRTHDIFFCMVFVFAIIELGSRRVVHFGVTKNPTDQWTAHFNHARPHQGIEQCIPCQPEPPERPLASGKIASRPVLGGLHHYYFWQARKRWSNYKQISGYLH